MRGFVGFLLSAGICVVACGGASGTDDLFNGATGGSSGSSASSGSSSSSSGSSGSSSGSSGTSSGTSGTSGNGSSGAGSSGTSGSSGVVDAGRDVEPPPDASTDPGIFCGGATPVFCTVKQQICCAAAFGTDYTCQENTGGCSGTPIACDDAADCPGAICCGRFDQSTGYRSVSCMQFCSGTSNGDTLVRFCNPKSVPDECAASGRTCQPSQGLPGFNVCQ